MMTQGPNATQPHTIVVTGVGYAFAQPPQATVILGVSTTASRASKAVKSNSHAMNQIMTAMRQMGIAESAIETSTFTLRPQYSRGQRTERRLIGFEVTLLAKVTTANTQVSELLDKVVEAGANQINSISFTFPREKHHKLAAEARQTAVTDARAKAETIASSLGVNIIGVVSAIEGSAPSPLVRTRSLSESPPISSPTEAAVAVSLRVTYLIESGR
jgi:uncharacterized protein YggE